MRRVFDFGDNHDFQPLIHDILKTLTILLVVETMLYLFNRDPLLDKIFVSMLLYILTGTIIYHLFTDKLIGGGPTCCHLRMAKPAPAPANNAANAANTQA